MSIQLIGSLIVAGGFGCVFLAVRAAINALDADLIDERSGDEPDPY